MVRIESVYWVVLVLAFLSSACSGKPVGAREDAGDGVPVDALLSGGSQCERGLCPDTDAVPYARWPEPLASLPRGDKQTASVCNRGGDDAVRELFCGDQPAAFDSLVELQKALAIDASVVPGASELGEGTGLTGISVTGHSTALSTRSVSSINPRVVTMRLEVPTQIELAALAFTRGEQLVEIVVRGRKSGALQFYVVGFRQACNDAPEGCTPGDLLTPAIESDWTEVTLYDEHAMANTTFDCAACHQPGGPGSRKMLRMFEHESPWAHWFFNSTEGGKALIADYVAAKGEEPLAGMEAGQIGRAHPGNLAMLISFGGHLQPVEYDSLTIEEEVRRSAAEEGGDQPYDNSVPGDSETWRATYALFRDGETSAVPFHDIKVTDPQKLARMTEAYTAYRRGDIERHELPDIRDVFPDDPGLLAAMGMMTEPGLDGEGVLRQACSQCHNSTLDQSVSRARFRADLVGMGRAERDLAIARMQLPEEDPLAMPPARLRRLTSEARARAIEALSERGDASP